MFHHNYECFLFLIKFGYMDACSHMYLCMYTICMYNICVYCMSFSVAIISKNMVDIHAPLC